MKRFLFTLLALAWSHGAAAQAYHSFYLRCNSTSWQLDSKSRFSSHPDPNIKELILEVKDQWIVDAGDDCTLTETSQVDVWGSDFRNLGLDSTFVVGQYGEFLKPTEANKTFKVRFPSLGRYRAIFQVEDSKLEINRVDLAPGVTLSWFLNGGSVTVDPLNRIFHQTSQTGLQLHLIDPAEGKPKWSYSADEGAYLLSTCGDQDRVYISQGEILRALDARTGQELWRFGSSAPNSYASISCPSGTKDIYSSLAKNSGELYAFDRQSGRLSWYRQAVAGTILAADGKNLYLTAFTNEGTQLTALDLRSGHVQWNRTFAEGYVSANTQGQLFHQVGATLTAIDDRGYDRWTYSGRGSYTFFEHRKDDLLIALEDENIVRIDPATGHIRWSFAHPKTNEEVLSYGSVSEEGTILYRSVTYASGIATASLIEKDRGSIAWTFSDSIAPQSINVFEDSFGHLILYSHKKLESIDPRTGAVRWVYRHEGAQEGEIIFSAKGNAKTLVLTTGIPIGKFPPMGIMALDADSGRLLWRSFENTILSLIFVDDTNAYFTKGFTSELDAYKL